MQPQPGPQEQFLATSADVAIAGGAAGVGKTWGLLLEPLRHVDNPEFGAVIFRRERPQITNQGGLWDESQKLFRTVGATDKETTLEWNFPTGARVKFAQMQYAADRFAWDGAQIPLIGFDQLEGFEEIQFWYMLARNRTMCGVKPYVRATCNPVPEDHPIGGWLNRLIAWWIDQETGYPIWERAGVIRWFVRLDETLHWADTREALIAQFPDVPEQDLQPKSFTFIPGTLEDNKALMATNPEYRANLLALPLVERERLLGGNWKIKPAAGKVFNMGWFEIVDAVPVEADRVRAWDKAGTNGAGDFSAGIRLARAGGKYYVEDAVVGQWSSGTRNLTMRQTAELDGTDVEIQIEQEPGSSGKESAEASIENLAGFTVRARPSTGDKVTRAMPLSAQAEAGNVKLLRGPWNKVFLSELHNFPDGKHDDQVDAVSIAFNKLALGPGPLEMWGGATPDAPKTQDEQDAAAAAAIAAATQEVDEAIMNDGVFWPGGRF